MKHLFSVTPILLLGVIPGASNMINACGTTPVEVCDNGRDDDGDGFTDCSDTECSGGTDVILSEIQHHPTKVKDESGEYVELMNVGDKCADISGWSINEDSGLPVTLLPGGSVVPPGALYVIAGAFYPDENCGVYAKATWKYDSTLNDTGCDTITLKDRSGVQINKVTYCTGSNGWGTCPDGAALEYCGEPSITANGTAASWVCATTTYGCGDKGTPAAASMCPVASR